MTHPIIVAHRGLAGYAPENTLVAYSAALDLGFGLEVDLSLTADGEIVNMHDRRFERTTSGEGIVNETPLSAIRDLDAGSWFHPSFSDQRVPALRDTLGLVCERRRVQTLVALDLKPATVPIESRVAQMVAEHGLLDQVLAIGAAISDGDVRLRLRAANAQFPTAMLVEDPSDWSAAVSEATADWLYIRFLPTCDQGKAAHGEGKRLFVAGKLVAGLQPDNWRRMRDAGVAAILTDFPFECRQALAE